ncbi:PmeII family type II restriction endonuclease [Ichthyenterobacterium magnum]|uniref:Type II restriction endonuclease EcoO109I-like protein n=1 Tax=Ichthyenterobacterium magnum TaxID=1230530 RepID=A0A420DXX4_9FLAO|nr:PmeII family type II restriction endonuclease [Ichthyenterobacterium magnum]RKE99057.1 type II restriction endonuclease EcoO109I-like protein [Ichthyenterobacterium magnum]
MNNSQKKKIIENAKNFFRDQIVQNHINGACDRASRLSEYNINPFLYKYLANFLTGNDDPESIAKALVLPRILGTSINTSFGMKIQSLISSLFEGLGSTTQGIDIEFVDAIDNRKKYCQLKAGPNTINKDDITTIINHFDGVRNLARTNNLNVGINDMIVGVVYGEANDLSSHYKKIENAYPVIVGQDFWHRLTGQKNFYFELIDAVGEVALEVDATKVVAKTIEKLAREIDAKFE